MKKLLLLFTLFCVSLSSWAYDFTADGIYYNITSSTAPYTVEVTYAGTSYIAYTGSVTIPSIVLNKNISYTVTSVGKNAF